MKYFIITLFVLLISACVAELNAQQIIAYIDAQYIVDNMPEGKKAKEQVDNMLESEQQKIKRLEYEIVTMQEEYQRLRPNLSAQQVQQREEELLQKQQVYQYTIMETDQQMKMLYSKLLEELTSKIRSAVSEIARNSRYSYVIDKEQLYYFEGGIDISDAVLQKLSN